MLPAGEQASKMDTAWRDEELNLIIVILFVEPLQNAGAPSTFRLFTEDFAFTKG